MIKAKLGSKECQEMFERLFRSFEEQLGALPRLSKKTKGDLIAGFRDGVRAGVLFVSDITPNDKEE